MKLGEKLYRLREEKGLSQEELAEELNVSRQTISNWENDKVKIDVEKAGEICKFFDVSMDELFGGGRLHSTDLKRKRKPSVPLAAVSIAVLSVCLALIIISAVFLSKYSPDEGSSTIILTPAAGWAVIACCAAVTAGAVISLIIIFRKRK